MLLVLLLGCAVWAVLGSSRVTHQPRLISSLTPRDLGLAFEPLNLVAADGIPLRGWWIPHPNPKGVLLLLHGFGTGKADLLDLARALHEAGSFHLALIDLRGHGESAGRTLSFGKKEVLDVEAVLLALAADPSMTSLGLGCLGVSMGGAIGLLSAARFPQIRAVVSDSSYADLGSAIARTQWLAYHIPRFPLGQMVIWATELRLGCRMSAMSPVTAVGKIAPRPILLIHGGKDRGILPSEAEALYQAAGEPKVLWKVPEAEHLGAFYLNRQEYVRRVTEFFSDAFRRASQIP